MSIQEIIEEEEVHEITANFNDNGKQLVKGVRYSYQHIGVAKKGQTALNMDEVPADIEVMHVMMSPCDDAGNHILLKESKVVVVTYACNLGPVDKGTGFRSMRIMFRCPYETNVAAMMIAI